VTLLELHTDLKETNRLLARIADALEFAAGMKPAIPSTPVKKAGLDDVSRVSNLSTLTREIKEEMRRQNPGRGGVRDEGA